MSIAAPARSMTRTCQLAARQQHSLSSQCLRISSQQSSKRQRRWQSTDAAAAQPTNPKIATIVDQISGLTLLETADLVQSLKTRLQIPDLSFAAPAAAAPAAAAPIEEEEAAPAPQEKSLFTLKLASFDAAAKSKIIKEVKSMLGLSLIDSKKFVESVPKVMKEGVTKEEGTKIVETVKALGGVVEME
ncbi:54S ribosomal protein L12, mitochondrial [Exophiala xenobiotica]|uniref:54S ribosomal protein L12, mitochondrial n=1 Tax=Lithohypha guttulata TaxID=1690604 RepID=A0ABR0KCL6_9EURO|nr:54S ribosomal protein L12, mitochondrial [Lithohypha guttulata]KAK5320301.1 54S ribosomal protein L12, mitochondrial [Exophiala xenobiotica]